MTEKRQPWLKFYTADWRGDAGLRAVGYAARGLWVDMLSLMHEAAPYGHLMANGQPIDAARLAARVGGTAREVQGLLDRLEMEGVFSRTAEGAIYSRRMVRDHEKAEKDRRNGKGGGNPKLKPNGPGDGGGGDNGGGGISDKAGVNPPDKAQIPETRYQNTKASPSPAAPPGDDADEPEPIDARAALWTEGLARLRRITGKPDGAARGLLGRFCKEARDDCALVSGVLHEAESARPGDPVAWIAAAIQARTGQRQPRATEGKTSWLLREMEKEMAAKRAEAEDRRLLQ